MKTILPTSRPIPAVPRPRARRTIALAAGLLLGPVLLGAQPGPFPFQDPERPIDERVEDIVSRLTLEEKIAQMIHYAPAIDRLGIPAYNWWNECLHGVARTDYKTTVFPQAIAMAATFDRQSLTTMADYTAVEGRGIYNDASAQGNRGIYHGLTYWTPNINIFRDPRWGRGHETYGEDPFLTGELGKAFVRGLQGEHPRYWKASACAKHYAVHSGPEPERHVFDIEVSAYDLWDTYLPAFRDLVVDAGVSGVMCAYNAYAGKPCCGSNLLMIDILRNQWGFAGYVVSDCGAIDDFWRHHRTHPDRAAAAADAVLNGTDLECNFARTYQALDEAVRNGAIAETKLDESLRRLFTIRMKLGLFDPVEHMPYHAIGADVLERPAHRAHALKMARQSIVLLKNDSNTLPLAKTIRKIAVVGPNANDEATPLANYNGTPSEIVTPLEGIRAKLGEAVEVVYEQGITHTGAAFFAPADPSAVFFHDGRPGFQAEYFANPELDGTPTVVRRTERIDQSWQPGGEVVPGVFARNCSARWTATFIPDRDGEYVFELGGDDGYRLRIDGQTCIESWRVQSYASRQHRLQAVKGQAYAVTVEYYQAEGEAQVRLGVGRNVVADLKQVADSVKDADAIVFVGGLSPSLEGEEMRVDIPGFRGGDRTSIRLPAIQTELLKALHAAGKPVVFVMMTGSAIACEWEAENLPAIVNAWYGGQAVGTAVADVLFGDYSPAGRLPVTFYRSDDDLPDFRDYAMDRRTYRYFPGEPRWAFGHGLSYTAFRYDQLTLPAAAPTDQPATVSVRVTNTGARDGEEVVQLYLAHPDGPGILPIRSLKGFERIAVPAGGSRVVTFAVRPRDLACVDELGQLRVHPGSVIVSVGGSQPDERALADRSVVQGTLTLAGDVVSIP